MNELGEIGRLALAAIFATAFAAKAMNLGRFRDVVASWALLENRYDRVLSVGLPALELAIVALTLSPLRQAGSVAALLFLAAASSVAHLIGRRADGASCGCLTLSPNLEQGIGPWLFVRNLLLGALALLSLAVTADTGLSLPCLLGAIGIAWAIVLSDRSIPTLITTD